MYVLKKIGLVVAGLAAAYITIMLLLALIIWGSRHWQNYQWEQNYKRWEEAQEKSYRDDVYGGKTPEETWGMFLEALKKEDVELASKYFVIEKQEENLKLYENLKKEKIINKSLDNFKTFEIEKKSDGKTAFYHIKMPFKKSNSGYIFSPVVFTLNPYTNIWKISVL